MALFSARRGSGLAAWLLAGSLACLLLVLLDASRMTEERARERAQGCALVARVGLTDLALLNEARYTRHLSQADRHAAFQDHPGALEHFPSGSLAGPPRPSP